MANNDNKVFIVRKGLTELVTKLSSVFSNEQVIEEVMVRRKYTTSPYADEMRKLLTEIGVFKIDDVDYLSELQILGISLSDEEAKLYGLFDSNGRFLLKGRYCIPIRDIAGYVTAVVGWYPDNRKYITTSTYGFSKEGQFFNIECFSKAYNGDYPKYVDEIDGSMIESKGLVFLVEGIFDTLSLRSLGFPALGNMGLEMSPVKVEILTRFNKVIAIPDNDNAGSGTNPISSSNTVKKWNIKNENVIVLLPDGMKDADDLIKGSYCMEDLLRCQKAKTLYRISIE